MPNKKTRDAPPRARPDRDEGDRILGWLAAVGMPMTADELAQSMQVRERQRAAFDAALQALQRSGAVLVNRRGKILVADKLDLVLGTVQGHADGFGFLVPENGGDDLFLSPREMHKALHGDRVAVRVTGTDRRWRPKARSSRSSSARTARSSGGCTRSTACSSSRPRPGPSTRTSSCRPRIPAPRPRGMSSSSTSFATVETTKAVAL